MKIFRVAISYTLVLAVAACVDRITFPIDSAATRIVIDGFITTSPPPYKINVSESIDIADPFNVDKPRSLKYLVLMDNLGNVDTLSEPDRTVGTFYTPANGMRGTAGRAYKLKFETRDGRVYESVYDTLRTAAGNIDSVYRVFRKKIDLEGKAFHGFDIYFNSSDPDERNLHLWQINTTYQVETDPKHHRMQCGGGPDCPPNLNCGCLDPLPCSGYIMLTYGNLDYVSPCECCTCWVTITNNSPIIQDGRLAGTTSRNIYADFILLTPYTFMYKVHAQVDQYTVSSQAYRFYKAVADQQQGRNSLFQPVTGKLPGNIVQISGRPVPGEGIFFAVSITSKAIFINRNEIPDEGLIPHVEPIVFANKKILNSCLDFPNSTNKRPAFWKD